MFSYLKRNEGSFLLWGQLVGATTLVSIQALGASRSTQGVSLSMLLLIEAFMLLNATLAYGAWRAQGGIEARRTMLVYGWLLCMCFLPIVGVAVNGHYAWSHNDTATMVVCMSLSLGVLVYAAVRGESIAAPRIKGLLGIAFKAGAQLFAAWKLSHDGNDGIPWPAVFFGHINIALRFRQIWLQKNAAGGWEENLKWLTVSESFNWLSWVIFTLCWLS